MRRIEIRSLLVVSFTFSLLLLVSVAVAQVDRQISGTDPGLARQIQSLRLEIRDLQRIDTSRDHHVRFAALSGELQRLERWNLSLATGHPARTEVQLRFQLGLLRLALGRSRNELGIDPPGPAPGHTLGNAVAETLANGTGTFSGTVTDSDTTSGISGVDVVISDPDGNWVTHVVTDGSGDFTTPPLTAGSYLANTWDVTGYINEIYDDIPCAIFCDFPSGELITVTGGSDRPGVDFALDPGGTISGTITDADTKLGVGSILVDIFDSGGIWLGNAGSDSNGNYLTNGLPAGDYYAGTYNWLQYIDELYDDASCPFGCDPTGGTVIDVDGGLASTGVDFELEKGGSITGNVKVDPAGPVLADVATEVFDSTGNWVTLGWTDGSGDYISERGLPTGTYYAKTSNDQGYVNELYDDKTCPAFCDVLMGDAIGVDKGVATSGIDFALDPGGLISGTVEAEGGGQPLTGVWVDIFDNAGDHISNGATDASGSYTIFSSLPPGTYKARTWNDQGYVNELYDDISCPNFCDTNQGNDIVVAAGLTTSGIDFALVPGGRISGSVTEEGSGIPLIGVFIDLYTPSGTWISNPSTDGSGAYLSPGLPPGTYFALTWNDQGYVNELYDGKPCFHCVITNGKPIVVAAGSMTQNIDFGLEKGATVAGTVDEEGTGLPIENIHVEVWSSSGQFLAWAGTDASGNYSLPVGLPAGLLFVKTWNDLGYINELYDDLPCAFCVATDGTPLLVEAGESVTGLDFSLSEGGLISGTVTNESTHAGIENISVHVHDLAGNWLQSTGTDSSGDYLMKVGLPTASYYVRTNNGQGYVNEVHSNIQCIGACEFDSATPVAVTAGSTTSGLDFELALGAKISGSVTDADSGLPIDDSEVLLFSSTGEFGGGAWVRQDGTYTSWNAVPAGLYYAATRNSGGYLDELYSGKPCTGGGEFCDVKKGSPILLAAGTTASNIDFTLELGSWFEGTVIDEQWVIGLDTLDVHIFDSSGNQVSQVVWTRPLSNVGAYQTCGLPPGTYYAQTDSSRFVQDYVNEIFDDIPCAEECEPTLGDPISVVNGVGTTGVDFELRFRLFSDGFEAGDTSWWSSVVQ